MLVYASEFPLNSTSTVNEYLDLAVKWLADSPNHTWNTNDILFVPNELRSYEKNNELVELGSVERLGVTLAGFRHSWENREQQEWITEIVGIFCDDSVRTSTRLYCNGLIPGNPLPHPKKPYIIKLLISTLGGGYDGELLVQDIPHFPDESDTRLIANHLSGKTNVCLPIIFASVDDRDKTYIDAGNIAHWVSGLAHVIVEPSRRFSFELRGLTEGANAYGGAVGIYWPDGTSTHTRLIPSRFKPDELERALLKNLRVARCETRPTPGSTWASLIEAASMNKIDELRGKITNSEEVDDFINAFDQEMKVKDTRLSSAEREIERLKAQVRALQSNGHVGGIINHGNESDLFESEIEEIVIQCLSSARANTIENSRSRHILDDLINANISNDRRSQYAEIVKNALAKCGTKIGKSDLSILESIGFEITSDGKHYKAAFNRDDRYTFTIPKTPSDHRATKNLTSTINNKLFK